jgi:hypothetical protein
VNIKMQCRGVRSDFLHVHTSEGSEFNDMIFAIHTDPTAKEDWSDVPNVILDPADALQLAIALMDWARDHMPKITPEMAAFGASYVGPFYADEYTANPQDWGFQPTTDELIDGIGEWR